jgi:hypothetical protein
MSPQPVPTVTLSIPMTTLDVDALLWYCGSAKTTPSTQVQTLLGLAVIEWSAALADVAEGRPPATPIKLPARTPAKLDNAIRVTCRTEDVALIKAASRSRTMDDLLGTLGGLLRDWCAPIRADMAAHGMG